MVNRHLLLRWIVPLLAFVLLFSCDTRSWKNPFDSDNFLGVEPPGNVTVTQLDAKRARLQWTIKDSSAVKYKVDKKIEDGDWRIGYGVSDKTAWIDTALVSAGVNYYRVYTYAGDNESLPVVASINPNFPGPTQLSLAQLSDTQIQISWRDNSKGEDGFKVDRQISDERWQIGYGITEPNIETWIDTAAVLNKKSSYRIYAFASQNISGSQSESITLTFPPPSEFLVTSIDDYRLKLTWNDHCDFETGFDIFRKENNDNYEFIAELPANSESYIDSNLIADIRYQYRLSAVTSYNQSEPEYSAAVTTYLPSPASPSLTSFSPDRIVLTWPQLTPDFITGYQIERSRNSSEFKIIETTSQNQFADATIDTSQSYTYRIRAVTKHNVSKPSPLIDLHWGNYYAQNWSHTLNDNVLSSAISPNKIWAASGGQDHTVNLWRTESGTQMWTGSQAGAVNTMAFDRSSQYLISGGFGGQIICQDVVTGGARWSQQRVGVIWSVHISIDNSKVVTTGQDNSVAVWDLDTGALMWSGEHTDDSRDAAFSRNNAVISIGDDGVVKKWNPDAGVEIWSTLVGGKLRTLDANDDAGKIAVGGSNVLAVLDLVSGDLLWSINAEKITHLTFSADGDTLFTGSTDGHLSAFESSTGGQLWEYTLGENVAISSLETGGDFEGLFTGDAGGSLIQWDSSTGTPLWNGAHSDRIWTVTVSKNGEWILSGGYDHNVKCWQQVKGWKTR